MGGGAKGAQPAAAAAAQLGLRAREPPEFSASATRESRDGLKKPYLTHFQASAGTFTPISQREQSASKTASS